MAERMYNALVLWVPWLPGGLMHSNIAACAMFGCDRPDRASRPRRPSAPSRWARSRSTVQRAAVPRHARRRRHARHPDPAVDQHDRLRRDDRHLDPQALSRGLHPRLLLRVLFSLTVLSSACIWKPRWGGTPIATSWDERIAALPDLLPPLVILLAVIGSIFCRLGDRDRSRGARRRSPRSASRPGDRRLTLAHAARRLRRHDAHHRHGHGDPARRLLPQLRHHRSA